MASSKSDDVVVEENGSSKQQTVCANCGAHGEDLKRCTKCKKVWCE